MKKCFIIAFILCSFFLFQNDVFARGTYPYKLIYSDKMFEVVSDQSTIKQLFDTYKEYKIKYADEFANKYYFSFISVQNSFSGSDVGYLRLHLYFFDTKPEIVYRSYYYRNARWAQFRLKKSVVQTHAIVYTFNESHTIPHYETTSPTTLTSGWFKDQSNTSIFGTFDTNKDSYHPKTIYLDSNFDLVFEEDSEDPDILINYFGIVKSPGDILEKYWDFYNQYVDDSLNNEYTTSFENSVNLYSYDIYLDNTFDKPFNFEIDVSSTESNIDLGGFEIYGLKKENGLYHWTKISNTENIYVDYDDNNYIENEKGFTFKGAFNYNLMNYEQIKLSIKLERARSGTITFRTKKEISKSHFDFNFIDINCSYSRIKNTNETRYIVFTTNEDLIEDYVFSKEHRKKGELEKVYIDYYDTKLLQFESYQLFDYYLSYEDFSIYRHKLKVGKSLSKSFYIYTNPIDSPFEEDHEIFEYFVYANTKMYYSYSNKLENVPVFDESGNVVDGNIKNDAYLQDISNLMGVKDYIKQYTSIFSTYSSVLSHFFNGLNSETKSFLVSIFVVFMICLLIKILRK